jgi:rubredoxin
MIQNLTSICPVCHGTGAHDFSSTDMMFGGDEVFAYHRCSDCGLVYQHPMPDGERIAAFYPFTASPPSPVFPGARSAP